MLEVEAKIKIKSIDPIRNRLKELGAIFDKQTRQTDTYFNSPLRDFAETDEALRVRTEDNLSEMTYKGPKIRGSGAKAREEYNVEISDPAALSNILSRTGFFRSAEVLKTREEYDFMGTKIALDSVDGLGEFIEIEVVTEDRDSALDLIENVRKKLEIDGEHISESYLEMLLEKREEIN